MNKEWKLALLAIISRHIIHTILKVNPKGSKAIVDSDWYYLMALSSIINNTLNRSEYLHYGLAKTGIEITQIYEMIDIDDSSVIDFDTYYTHTSYCFKN